jgi:DNA-binding GntR family transcriptional regulator
MSSDIPPLKSIETWISLKEMAFETIKEAILSNQLRPGNLYSEPSLARELGISRTPVREALLELASRGFLTFIRNKGFQITEFGEQDIRNLFAYRRALELAVVREITPSISDHAIEKLKTIRMRDIQAANTQDRKGCVRVDREFHLFLASLTRNPYMISALENVRDLIDWTGTKILERKERPKEVLQEHGAIMDRIKTRDQDGAVSMMEKHLRITERLVLAHMRVKEQSA